MELWSEIRTEQSTLDKAVTALRTRGAKKAQAEHDYRVALSKRLLDLRAEGYPASIIRDIAVGAEDIAKLRLERDIAASLYESAQEAINVQKLKIRILENQLSREWVNVR